MMESTHTPGPDPTKPGQGCICQPYPAPDNPDCTACRRSATHTPGPWQSFYTTEYGEPRAFVKQSEPGITEAEGLTTVATCWDPSEGEVPGWAGEVAANATLIAAAPDLLEMCLMVRDRQGNLGPDDARALNAAIGRATGGAAQRARCGSIRVEDGKPCTLRPNHEGFCRATGSEVGA